MAGSIRFNLPDQLQNIIDEMMRCLDAKLYYAGLLIALTLPELCSALTMQKSEFVKSKHYELFLNEYVDLDRLGIDAKTCFRLRGGMVHRGNAVGHEFIGFSHIIFFTPESKLSIHRVVLSITDEINALNIEIYSFCNAMRDGVLRWFENCQSDDSIFLASQELLSPYPNGMHPFITGAYVVGSGPVVTINAPSMMRVE